MLFFGGGMTKPVITGNATEHIGDTPESFSVFGRDLFGAPVVNSTGALANKFTWPPFSVLDARSGNWQERKRAWLAVGIEGEKGRSAKTYNTQGWVDKNEIKGNAIKQTGTSIFDPVLCELAYTWFCPPGGQIVDPFAGGSVRGITAQLLGFKYWGCDLSAAQIAANYEQSKAICSTNPEWVVGDATNVMDNAPPADFIFTCPPYGDLERYSDNPSDLSTMEYHTFMAAFKRIILRCGKTLKDGRFACVVVGDFRDKRTGNYRGFVADTINGFRECGMALYNDAILLTPAGSLPIRVSAQFENSRKLGKTHQNILVFVKGGAPARDLFIEPPKPPKQEAVSYDE